LTADETDADNKWNAGGSTLAGSGLRSTVYTYTGPVIRFTTINAAGPAVGIALPVLFAAARPFP